MRLLAPQKRRRFFQVLFTSSTRSKVRWHVFCSWRRSEAESRSFIDALDFQGKILEEDVLLDISSIRYLKCALDGFHVRQIDAPRVQLWHQRRSISQSSREAGSFSSSGTTLSAASPDRTTLLCSRLVMFLGRAQEYLTLFGQFSSFKFAFQSAEWFQWYHFSDRRCIHQRQRPGYLGIRTNKIQRHG